MTDAMAIYVLIMILAFTAPIPILSMIENKYGYYAADRALFVLQMSVIVLLGLIIIIHGLIL